MTLKEIVEQLEFCQFECPGGPLRNNVAFIELKKLAEPPHQGFDIVSEEFQRSGGTFHIRLHTEGLERESELAKALQQVVRRWVNELTDTLKQEARIAYEADIERQPLYHDGTPRPEWNRLSAIAQWSWERNPTPRQPCCQRDHDFDGNCDRHPIAQSPVR